MHARQRAGACQSHPHRCLQHQRPRRVASRASAAAAVTSAADGGSAATQVAPAPSRGPQEWHDVDQPLLWTGDEDAALAPGSPPSALPAPWKMMLLSDGSVTRHLQLLTGQPIQVECLSMDLLPHHHQPHQQQPTQQQPGAQEPHQQQQEQPQEQLLLHLPPPQALQIPGPLVQRQVLLWPQQQQQQGQGSGSAQQCRRNGAPLVYAASWWASASVDRYLADKDLPIWVSLARGHLELYREIQTVSLGHSAALEAHFGCPGPFWGRTYFFWHDGAPLTLIHEVFSNSLEAYLGNSGAAAGGGGAAGAAAADVGQGQ